MKTFTKVTSSCLIAFGVTVVSLLADVGSDNPTGIAGQFDDTITTGCAYSAYTANATRSITDLVVSGSVGSYPLALTRTLNTRYKAGLTYEFGGAANWLHSFSWSIDTATVSGTSNVPASYAVNYPDGRQVFFSAKSGDPDFRGPLGVRDRLEQIQSPSATQCCLRLSDGGKVYFAVDAVVTGQSGSGIKTSYNFLFQKIVDPYGAAILVSRPGDGSMVLTEPAGRMLKIFYKTGPAGDKVIDRVEEWMSSSAKGRTVTYNYTAYKPGTTTFSALTSVTYPAEASLVPTATYTYQPSNTSVDSRPLIRTCVDPMYHGAMWKIGYTFVPKANGGVYGQLQSENYFDGTSIGTAVSSIATSGANGLVRIETRGDGPTRRFKYGSTNQYSGFSVPAGYLLADLTDFKANHTYLGYDSNGYINAVNDRNGHITNYTNNALTGSTLTITYPATPEDEPSAARGVVSYNYGGPGCADGNNQDANNPYYQCSVRDQGGHSTTFTRDNTKRVTRVDYPDGGYETFAQYNNFNQFQTHLMTTGGTEAFTYDARGLKQSYRDPDNDPIGGTGNPTALYKYDSLDRLTDVTDSLGSTLADPNHTNSYSYNARGQRTVLTHAIDPNDPNHTLRRQVSYGYNPNGNGTLVSVTDELNHATSYSYDDYKRVKSTVTPPRFSGDTTPHTTYSYYDASGNSDDYRHTDANVTYLKLPSGKQTAMIYDENYRKTSVTVGAGTSDAATTSFGYDNVGNPTTVMSPNEQSGQQYAAKSTVTAYDARNRPYLITDAQNHSTTTQYDTAGRQAKITRANGQTVTFDSYDEMNRLLQQTVKQTPDPDAVTKYTYYRSAPFGLLQTMQDPALVAGNTSYSYSCTYDGMGRKRSLTYPPATTGATQTLEQWHYDSAGRNDTYTNRAGKIETLTYDALYRLGSASWNDQGVTPTVNYGFDGANRLTSIANGNATISRVYFDDNLLNSETTTCDDNTARTVTYTYDADGNRGTLQYPSGYSLSYGYTNRNQAQSVISGGTTLASYIYDPDGNISNRTLANSTSSAYSYDELDRALTIAHSFVGTTRTLAYGYDAVGNRKWTKRDSANGDVFGYDANDQSTSVLLNVANPDSTQPGPQTISYDANGNRISFAAYGTTDTYTTNYLNEYTSRNSNNAQYNTNGDIMTGLDGSSGGGANLAGDPGFENGTSPWTMSGNCGVDNYTSAHSGSYFFAFNNGQRTPNGVLSQVINTTSGTSYTLSFWHGAEAYNQTASQKINISVKDGTTTLASQSFTDSVTAGASINVNWVSHSVTFTATSASTTIQFADDSMNPTFNTDSLLDDVSVTANAGASPSTYTYDAQNRLLTATKSGASETFVYDGLNRAVKVTPSGANPNYFVYDGWNLICRSVSGSLGGKRFVYGPGGLIQDSFSINPNYYYQDASGSTSHYADNTGHLLEWYRYDLHGTPIFYNASNTQLQQSNYTTEFLFTGQKWQYDIGLYDLRNRFYSPDIGRFLQPDPMGFSGDAANLYRHCGNNPTNLTDPLGDFGIVQQNGYNVNIVVPIYYLAGSIGYTSSQVAAFNTGIEYFLTGSFDGGYASSPYTVSTSVAVLNGSSSFSNFVNSWAGNAITVFQGAGTSESAVGGSIGRWMVGGSNGMSPEYTAAHEALHLLGLDDMNWTDDNGVVHAIPGFEDNIMGGVGGTEIAPWQIEQIVQTFAHGWTNKARATVINQALARLGPGSGALIPATYSRTFGFSQNTNGSLGGYPEFGPWGWDAMGGTYGPEVLGDLGLGGGGGFKVKWL
jgi:RHS repeat-associated protein